MAHTDVRASLLIGKPGGAVGVIEFSRTLSCIPLRAKVQHTLNFLAADAVTTFVRPSVRSVLDTRAWNGLANDIGQFADPVVFLCQADIENLVVNEFSGCFQHSQNGCRDVTNVNNGAPGSAIALDVNATRSECRSHKVIEHNIQPQPG